MPDTPLQQIHRPLLEVFPRLTAAADAARFELSAAQTESFARDGFVAPVPVLDADQVVELRERVDRIQADLPSLAPRLYEVEPSYTDRPDAVVCHFLGGWMVDPWLHDLVFSPAVTVPLAQLLGLRKLRFWHDQVFYKPPHHPGHVPWHQDYSYWTRTTPPRHITMNIVLDDTDEESGCLHCVPGSHRWDLLPAVPFDAPKDAVLGSLTVAQQAAFRPQPVALQAGQASIHHSHTVHGSDGNSSPRPRRALVLNYMGPRTRSADGTQPLLAGTPVVSEGALIEGDHFPLVLVRE